MTITFENDNDVIVYALEKVISYARRTQQIFVAQCVWWLASIISLETGLINHIDNLQKREDVLKQARVSEERREAPEEDQSSQQVHPDRVAQISAVRPVSTVPRDLTEDQRLDRILEEAEEVVQNSLRDREAVRRYRVNPLPTTKTQLKKARKVKRLQEARDKAERERQERLRQLRDQVIEKLSRDGLV
jgi:hypothetical protein